MFELTPAARMTLWGNAALKGATSLDEAARHIVGEDPPHRVARLPREASAVSLTHALGRLRSLGTFGLRLVLPVPGDPAGLPGPPSFNQLAVSAGSAVLCLGQIHLGLLNDVRTSWTAHAIEPAPHFRMSVEDAERMLRQELREGTEELVRLDVARWQPEAAHLIQTGSGAAQALPDCYPSRSAHVLALAQRLDAIVQLGARTDGAAVSARQMSMRQEIFNRLDVAVRRATEAACNVIV